MSPKFSKKDPDLNLTLYFDLSNTNLAIKFSPLTLKSNVIGWVMSLIVNKPFTLKELSELLEDEIAYKDDSL